MSAGVLSGDRLLTRVEAASALGLAPQTLSVWAMTGRYLPVIKCGRAARYRVSDIEQFIDRQTIPASTDGPR